MERGSQGESVCRRNVWRGKSVYEGMKKRAWRGRMKAPARVMRRRGTAGGCLIRSASKESGLPCLYLRCRTLSYPSLPCCILPCNPLSYPTLPCPTCHSLLLPCLSLSYLALPFPSLPCSVLPCPTSPCPSLSCCILAYPALPFPTLSLLSLP